MAFKRTRTGRRIVTRRRPVRRASRRMSMRRPNKIYQQINNYMRKNAETKYTDNWYFKNLTTALNRGASQDLFSQEYSRFTNYPVTGTQWFDRQGDKIQNVKVWLTLYMEQFLAQGTYSPYTILKIRVVVFSLNTGFNQTAAITGFFDISRNASVPIFMNPINKDAVKIYYDKTHDLSAKNQSQNSALTAQTWAAKTLSLNFNLGKSAVFSGNTDQTPKYQSQVRYVAFLPWWSDSQVSTSEVTVGRVSVRARLYYKDF